MNSSQNENISDKCRVENQNTHLTLNNFFSPKNRAVYETICKIR